MTYLLDTDTLSNLMSRSPSPALIRRIATVPDILQFTSSISLGELLVGAYRLPPERGAELAARLDAVLPAEARVLPFDAGAARIYGSIRAYLEGSGQRIGDADTAIAAIALQRGLMVVTGNVRHFSRVPDLTVENWLV